jgi:hypothetical protein
MDILDNLIYATMASAMQPVVTQGYPANPRVISDYISPFTTGFKPINVGSTIAPVFSYSVAQKMDYCAYEDAAAVETAILRHWYDVNSQVNYDSNGVTPFGTAPGANERYASFELSSNYHLIFAYLIENTRLLQIMERMIEKYLTDEELGIAEDSRAFNWIQNTERLFFKNDTLRSSNIRSLIRPSADATRRNAYWRMFGMDLAFGDINSSSNGQLPYIKAKTSNQQFVPLFEKYLSEIWQSYINANNSSGINTSDINVVVDLATQLRELLIARRGDVDNTNYANQNLSREEYASVLMTSWFMFVIADDSPVVQFLNCQSSTIGERLIKIGYKVGIPAHTKSQALFEMAGAAANVLRTIEQGEIFNNPARMSTILRSLVPQVPPPIVPPPATENMNLMSDLLTVINNWEKATGHKIKLSDTGYVASVRVQQNGQSVQRTIQPAQPVQPAMN